MLTVQAICVPSWSLGSKLQIFQDSIVSQFPEESSAQRKPNIEKYRKMTRKPGSHVRIWIWIVGGLLAIKRLRGKLNQNYFTGTVQWCNSTNTDPPSSHVERQNGQQRVKNKKKKWLKMKTLMFNAKIWRFINELHSSVPNQNRKCGWRIQESSYKHWWISSSRDSQCRHWSPFPYKSCQRSIFFASLRVNCCFWNQELTTSSEVSVTLVFFYRTVSRASKQGKFFRYL